MATVNELVVEQPAVAVDELQWLVHLPILDDPALTTTTTIEVEFGGAVEVTELRATDELDVRTIVAITEQVSPADEVFPRAYIQMVEQAAPGDVAIASSTASVFVTEYRAPRDVPMFRFGYAIDEFAPVFDEPLTNLTPLRITEQADVSDELLARVVASVILDEQATPVDEITERRATPLLLEDFQGGADEYAFGVRLTFEDLADAGGQPLILAEHGLLLESVAFPDAEAFARVTTQAFIDEVGTPTDWWYLGVSAAKAWLMNPESTAMTVYDNWAFYDMMQVGDTVYAMGPHGLMQLGDSTDGGRAVDAEFGYGYTDFDSDRVKRMDNLWMGYTADQPMAVTVDVYKQSGYTYAMPAKDASEATNNRVRPGKGLSGRYWRVTIKNTNGGRFRVDTIAADLLSTGRRV